MINITIEQQARAYVFDLNNKAKEHWFKADEEWDLCLASGVQKLAIEKKYHPTISQKALPEALIQLQRLVNAKMKLHTNVFPVPTEEKSGAPEFLMAYNKNRKR